MGDSYGIVKEAFIIDKTFCNCSPQLFGTLENHLSGKKVPKKSKSCGEKLQNVLTVMKASLTIPCMYYTTFY